MKRLLVLAALLSSCSQAPTTGPVVSPSEAGVVWAAAEAAERRMGDSGPAPFRVEVALVDPYGNESTQPALSFAWSQETLRRINRSNVAGYQLVNLADVTILSRRGVIALAEWCGAPGSGSDGRGMTPRLCSAERSRAETAWAALIASS